LKPLVLLFALVAVLDIAACGNSKEEAAPLALDQRVPSAQDAPGSKADPVEKRVTVSGPDEFISRLGERFINPTQKDVTDFKQSGFLRAIHDTRFFPATPGGPHARNAVHIFSLVMQFKSREGAQDALDFFHTDSLRPCPRKCSTQIKEFDVDISDAHGVRRYATAENIQATGDEGPPYDSYEIQFADGPFAYRISLFGPPGEVSQDMAEEIAGKLYDRVAGAPPQA
jgi:hypothetical protein